MGADDKSHPILPMSPRYRVERIDWRMSPRDAAYLELTVRRGDETKCLRFHRPREVFIEKGYDGSYSGLTILDISGRGWDDVRVQVLIDEAHAGIGFFASEVVEILYPANS
jgi:hypothetical protein